jgi:hypothetical protein
MRSEVKDFRRFVFGILGFGWTTTVFAATVIGELDLIGLPWAQIGLGCVLSLWGGLTRSAERALEPRPSPESPFRLLPELWKDLTVSVSCGFVTFSIGAWQKWDIWILGLALWAAGYLGARLLSTVADAVFSKIKSVVGPKQMDVLK